MSGGRRRLMVSLCIALGACAPRSRPLSLPETAAGGWSLQETRREQKKITGIYRGPGVVHVEVDDTGASVTAFDRAQRARPQPDTVFFYKGNYFITVKWESADREALRQFVRDLEKRLE